MNEAYLFDTNPTNLRTDVAHGIQEAGLPWIAVLPWIVINSVSKFS
jgi:hypothetical protein